LTTLIFDQLKPGKKYTNEGRRRIFGCRDIVAAVKAVEAASILLGGLR
jgi:hypothetical protein